MPRQLELPSPLTFSILLLVVVATMSTTVSKILISFDEYTRLKDIERKYEELKGNKTDSGKFTRILKIVASVVRVASKMFS